MINKPLPQNDEAEKIVIAAILKDNDMITELMDILKADDFYNTRHKIIYENMIQMFSKDIPIEVISVCNFIGKDKLIAIGGITYLSELLASTLTTNISFYADIVAENSRKRELIKKCEMAINEAYKNSTKTETIVNEIENTFLQFSDVEKEKTVSTEELMFSVLNDIDRKAKLKGGICGISTGFGTLDKATNGYQKGDLWILAGRPSMGKTLFNLNLMNKLDRNHNALMFELEMTKEKIGNRLLSATSKIQAKTLSRGNLNDEEFQAVGYYCNKIAQKNNIYVNCKTGIGLAYIRAEAKKIKLKHGLDIIFIDHLGLLKGTNPNNRNLELGELTRGLKALAKDLDVCVVCLCQLSRAVEQRPDKHPLLSDLRESGHIEEDSDVIMLLYRDDYYAEREDRNSNNPNTLECFIAKNRDGEVGGNEFYCDLKNQFIGEKAKG